jgi:DNA primase
MESDAVMSAIRAATPIRTQEPYQVNAYSNQSTNRSGGYNQQQRGPAPASSYYDAPPTGIYPEEAGSYVPDDYIPAEAQDAEYISTPTYTEPVALTADERVQLTAERELLGMMATDIDAFRPSAERIASLAWADESHEAMAWAMLATPVGATPAEVVQAAMVVTPDATKILSSGRVASTSELNEEGKVAFVLDTVELYSTRRKIAVLRARIRNGDGNVTELFSEATELQRQASQLLVRLQETTAGSR